MFGVRIDEVPIHEILKVLDIFHLNVTNEVDCKIILDFEKKKGGWEKPKRTVKGVREIIGQINGIRLYEVKLPKQDWDFDRKNLIIYKDSPHPKQVNKECLIIEIRVKIRTDAVLSKIIT